MAYSCPDCGTPLTVSSVNGGRTLDCPSCHGRMYGLSPFERLLADGVGARVWTGAAEGGPAGLCPYCSGGMHRPDADPDAAAGLAVCRSCQQVWVPCSASGWMSAHAAPTAVAGAAGAVPSECTNCGAPYRPDEDGRCRWCRAQIAAPQPLVVLMQPEPQPEWGLRLI